MIHVLFEAENAQKAEVLFWQLYLLSSPVQLHCIGGNKGLPPYIDNLKSTLSKTDSVYVIFDRINTIKYVSINTSIFNAMPYNSCIIQISQDGVGRLRNVIQSMKALPCASFLCNELSFEALVLRSSLTPTLAKMLLPENKYQLYATYLASMSNCLKSLWTCRNLLQHLYSDNTLFGGTPEKRLSSLLLALFGDTHFRISKGDIGYCWGTKCANPCYVKKNEACIFENKSFSTKKACVQKSIQINNFADLFTQIT